MMRRHLPIAAVFVSIFSLFTAVASAADSPLRSTKPIRIVVPLAPGGNLDIVARAIAEKVTASMEQQVIVENRPGASSLLGTQLVAKAPPDGHTLEHIANTLVAAPSFVANTGYDPLKDFAAVSMTAYLPHLLVVRPALPVKNVADLIALARAQPGALTYGSSGTGASAHLAALIFCIQAGVKMAHVPYKGNAPALIDVIGGQITLLFDTINTSVQYVKSGRLRALAVTSRTRTPLFPDIPTIAESGLPDYEMATWNGLVVPAATPHDVVGRLFVEVSRAVKAPDVRARFAEQGVEMRASDSPEEFGAFLRSEFTKYAKFAKEAGIVPE